MHSHSHHNHDHKHHDHNHGHYHNVTYDGNKKGLLFALIITGTIMFMEFFGGLFTNSLALLSDSAHMLSDAISLLLSFIAISFSVKLATPKKTYGYHRFEILAALFNGVTLIGMSLFIIWEAIGRFIQQEQVLSGTMIIIASIGLLSNLINAYFLMKQGDVKNNINLRSAYLHVLSDALGSLGAILAGVIMYFFKWYAADPIISILVSILFLKGGYQVLKHSLHILMEGTPDGICQISVKESLLSIDGVLDIHDLHIWTITSNLDSLSCHLLISDDKDSQDILQKALNKMYQDFKIEHNTIQIEKPRIMHPELTV